MRKAKFKGVRQTSNKTIVLIALSILQFALFPIIHSSLYNSDNKHYYIQDFYYESLRLRLELEKLSSNYSFERLEFLNSILQFESDSILSLTANRSLEIYNLKYEYLDSMRLLLGGADLNNPTPRLPRPGSGGGMPRPPEFLVVFKNGETLMIHLSNNTIGEEVEQKILNQRYFYERELDLSKELGLWDFWISSVSLFNFSEMIPNSIPTRLIWLFQSAITFLFLLQISRISKTE